MKLLMFFTFAAIQTSLLAQTLPLAQATADAYMITRMAEKFHVQPRLVDNSFSNDMFDYILHHIDERRIYFNLDDINKLKIYRNTLDDEVKLKQNDFLKLLLSVYQERIRQADTMIDNICNKAFDFSGKEKFTSEEDTTYPAGIAAMHAKLYKTIKSVVLDEMIDAEIDKNDSAQTLSKKEFAALEEKYRNKTAHGFKRDIKMQMEYPGGMPQMIAEMYCNAVAACYDPHTTFLPLTEKENFEGQLGNNIYRFGFDVEEADETEGGVSISNLKPGSPAFKSGQLNKGDKLIALQWEGKERIDVSDASEEEIGDILKASNHDKLLLTVKKADGTIRELTLQKEGLEPDEQDNRVKSFLLKSNKTIGYISLSAFYSDWEDEAGGVNGCANDVASEIIKLQRENIEGLILDLRYNGGGSVQEAVDLAGIFIDAGPVGQVQNKAGKIYTLKDVNRGTVYNGPLLLLVNGYSASASEIVAGTLQDYNRAVIAGTPTYGKATSQVVMPMDTTVDFTNEESLNKKTASYLKVTVSKLYRINGATAQKNGVIPDVVIPDILTISGEREANEPLVLNVNAIAANKFYKPAAPVDTGKLRSDAGQQIIADKYFTALKEYIRVYNSLEQSKDIDLNWQTALEQYKKDDALFPEFTRKSSGWNAGFVVDNSNYEKQRIESDHTLQALNDEIKSYLSSDHSLSIAFNIISQMAQ